MCKEDTHSSVTFAAGGRKYMCLRHVSCAVLSPRRVLRYTFTLMKQSPAPARSVPLHRNHVSSVSITTKLTATWSTSMPALLQTGDAYSTYIALILIVSVSLPRFKWYQKGFCHLLFQIYHSFVLGPGSRMSRDCIMAFLAKLRRCSLVQVFAHSGVLLVQESVDCGYSQTISTDSAMSLPIGWHFYTSHHSFVLSESYFYGR